MNQFSPLIKFVLQRN